MATVTLNANESYIAASAATIRGASGSETVKIYDGVAVTLDSNLERIEFARASSAYLYKATANGVEVSYNGTVVANLFSGDKAAFTDGSAMVAGTIVGSTLSFTLGGAAVSSTAGAVVPTLATGSGEASTVGGSTGGGTAVGQAFSLTTGADVKSFNAGNDTITGATGTLNSNDIITDASSTDSDSLTAVITGSAPGTSAPTIINVENIALDFKGFGVTYNAGSTSSGTITASTTQEGNNSASLTGLTSTVKVAAGTGINTLSLTGTTTTLNLAAQAVTLTGGGISEQLTVNSSGSSANTLSLASTTPLGTATTVKLIAAGDQSLTVKGNVADLTGKTVTKSLTGTAKLTFEVNSPAGATADLSKVAADSFNLNVTNAVGTNSLTLQTGSNVVLSKDIGSGALTASTVGISNTAADTLSLSLKNDQTALVTSGFETVNLAVDKASAVLTAATFGSTADVIVTGSNNLTVSDLASAKSFDASGLSSATLTLSAINGTSGASAAVTVVGSSGNDTITHVGSTVGVTLVTSSGNDTINSNFVTTATSSVDTVIAGAGNDTINIGFGTAGGATSFAFATINGGEGTDTLNFASGTSASTRADFTTAATTLNLSGITNVENVNVFLNDKSAAAATTGLTITLADSNVAAGQSLNLALDLYNALTVATAGAQVTINGGAELDGALNITVSQTGAANATVLNITGGAGNDTINGGKGADIITGGKGVDVIYLNAGGNDTVKFANGDSGKTAATADQINGANAGDTVVDYTAASISATFVTGATLGTGWTVGTSSGVAAKSGAVLDDFIAAMTSAASAGATGISNATAAFVSGSDLYVYVAGNDATLGTDDFVVKIVGASANTLTISSGDIVLA